MSDQRTLLRYYLVAILGSIAVFTVAYSFGMTVLEGEPRSLIAALEVVVQTYTTTGYGQDAGLWDTAEMKLLAVSMQVVSQILLFAALPVVVVPLLEDALATSPPVAREELSDHVVVMPYSARADRLIEELTSWDIDYVVVDSDREVASDLHENDYNVVHGDPETTGTLEAVNLDAARALVIDGDDEVTLSVVMSATDVAPEVPIYSVVKDPEMRRYHEQAGADEVFSPRTMLGRGLANKVTTAVEVEAGGNVELGEDFEVAEVPIQPGSELAGATVEEARVESRTGATLIGVWSRGEFRGPPFEDLVLDEHAVLLVVGHERQFDRLTKLTDTAVRRHGRGEVVVAGHGVAGATVAAELAAADVQRTVIDLEEGPSVDVAGDVTDPKVLEKAGVDDARTVILALDDDTTALLATFVIREVNPDVELIARAEKTDSVAKLYRAGADYVLALATVTGRLLASNILAEEVLTMDSRIHIIREPAGSLAGTTIDEARIEERTGCSVVAIERRDGRVITDLGSGREIRATDHLVIAGTDRDVDRFNEEFESASD